MREKNTTTRRRNAKRAQNAVAMLLLIASLLSMGGFAFATELEPQPPAQEEPSSPTASEQIIDPEQPGADPEKEPQDPKKEPDLEEPQQPQQPEETDPEETDPKETEPESSPAEPNLGIMLLDLDDPEGEPAPLAPNDIAVRYFVAENGEWKEITPANSVADGSMSLGKNRYYVTVDTVYNVYSAYGFEKSHISSADDRIFPHTKVEDKNTIYADAAPAQNTEGVWCIPLGGVNESSEYHIYYTPNNKTDVASSFIGGNKAISDTQLKKDNSFYSVEVNTSELGSEEVGLVSVSASRAFTGSTVTVTLPKLGGDAHWRLTDGERSLALPETKNENDNNTVTYTIYNIASRYVFSVNRGLTVEYDAALGEQITVGNNVVEDGRINGKSVYTEEIADGQAHTVLRIDKDTVTVNKYANTATRKIYYTFKGWRLGDTDTVYTYTETNVPIISYEALKAEADETGTVKLKAVWSPYIQNENGVNFIATAGFYIQKGIEVHATDYDYTITNVSEFTETTFNSRVVGTPKNATHSNYDLIKKPDTPDVANKVNEQIRNALVTPFEGIEFLDKMPSDEEVFDYLRSSNKVNDILNLQQQNLPKEKLTPDRFTVRWYVVKYDITDGFHVDGVIVAKPATLIVKKTFAGDSAAIAEVKKSFNITIEHDVTTYDPVNGNQATGNHTVDFKLELAPSANYATRPKDAATGATLVGYDSYDEATNTYTWILTGLQGVDYQVIENNYQLNDTNIEQDSTYRVTNSRVQNPGDIADTGWQPYTTTLEADGHRKGAQVRMYAYADDYPMASRQTITLHNTYTKPGVITVFKSDMTSEDKPGGGIPDVAFTLGNATGQALPLYRNGTTPYYSTAKADDNYVPVTSAVTDEHGHFFVELSPGTYTLTETKQPTGYNGAGKVKFTVNADNTIDADSIEAQEKPEGYGELTWASVNKDNNKQLDVINRPLKFDITVKNTWRDENGEADTANTTPVQLDLYRNNVKIETVTLPVSGDTPWQHTWDDMPMFVNGALAEYSVTVAKIGDTYRSSDLLGTQDGYANYNVAKEAFEYTRTGTEGAKKEPYWKNESASTAEEREKIIFAEHLLIGVNIQPINGALSFKKHADTLSGPALAGAKYTLYNDASLTSVHKANVTSDASGIVNFGALAAGDYFLIETEAPKGFVKDETVYKVSVLAGEAKMTKYKDKPGEDGVLYTGEEAKTYVYDVVNKTELEITVNNKSIYGDALTGGKIALYKTDENGQNAQPMENSPLVMTEDGVKVTLGQGTYRLVQTEVTKGYVKYETAYDFKVDNGQVYGIAILRTLRLMRSRDIVHVEGYDITGSAADGFTITLYNKPVEAPESPSGSPSTPPDSSTSPNPSPTTTPAPTLTPAPGRWYNPYNYGGLPQTGQVNWPVPVLIIPGAALCIAGAALMKKRGKK